jgi:acyl-CoA thioesterase FadM
LPHRRRVRQDRPITDLTAADLALTHHSTVSEDQIDHLGHMNVRFYGVNAHAGTAELLHRLVADGAVGPLSFRAVDVYTRHHREQLLGARLAVRSGVLDVDDRQLRLYHELANEDTGVLAATFVHRMQAEVDGAPAPVPPAIAARARALVVTLPEHGATRSITLDADPVAVAPSLADLRGRKLAIRKVREVTAEECDADGSFLSFNAPGLTWGGEPIEDLLPHLLQEGPNGERMGWASMETRMVIRRLPRRGDRIQSFSAVIGLRDKTSHRIQWAYDVDREDLLVTFEVVNLAFDTNARRPMSIPDRIRAAEQTALHADLAPRPRDAAAG